MTNNVVYVDELLSNLDNFIIERVIRLSCLSDFQEAGASFPRAALYCVEQNGKSVYMRRRDGLRETSANRRCISIPLCHKGFISKRGEAMTQSAHR